MQKSKFELMFPILKYHDNLLTFDRQVLIDRLNQGTDEFKTGRQRVEYHEDQGACVRV